MLIYAPVYVVFCCWNRVLIEYTFIKRVQKKNRERSDPGMQYPSRNKDQFVGHGLGGQMESSIDNV